MGHLVLVEETDSKLVRDGTHVKLVHEHWAGPWQVTAIEQSSFSYQATLSGRRKKRMAVSTVNINRPTYSRRERTFTVVAPSYTLTGQQPTASSGDAWKWRYRGRHQKWDGVGVPAEEEVMDSFTSLQLGVFHSLWGTYKEKDCRSRPAAPPSKQKRDRARAAGVSDRH